MAAAACSAMEPHDRRLSISKTSASKISKPSQQHGGVLKNSSSTTSAPSPSSCSSSPPPQLPSSIASSPSRPIAKVVNADPSSFRRVVQELTGTNFPTNSHVGSARAAPSRLQRIAPPPLRTQPLQQLPQRHLTLLEQMQHQQTSHHHPHYLEQQSLPMLSPHLLSPLPALTPGDNTWANPIEATISGPASTATTNWTLPPLLPLPAQTCGYGDGLLSVRLSPPPPLILPSTQGQALPPLLATPPAQLMLNPLQSNFTVLPPWSPTAFPGPFSPSLFAPSPGPGPPPAVSPGNMNGS